MERMNSILHQKSFEGTKSSIDKLDDIAYYPKKIIQHEDSLLSQVLFSLKHEPINLYTLALALRNTPSKDITQAVNEKPNSALIRKAALLWEHVNQSDIDPSDGVSSKYIDFFDQDKYITGSDKKHQKWRINFNGIGDLNWCPTILRTDELTTHLENDILKEVESFKESIDKRLLHRAIQWTYLSETKGSFEIENENPSNQKKEAFSQVIKKSQQGVFIDEDYLCSIQREVITSPYEQEFSYRHKQNRLESKNGYITYLPPPPEQVERLMQSIESLANEATTIEPLCLATALSFGLVYVHPFMDGNGRISRFLTHYALSKYMPGNDGMILPISMAMKNNESEYLDALESFSLPAANLFESTRIDHEQFDFKWHSNSDIFFMYPDMTSQAIFMHKMAEHALNEDIKNEVDHLIIFDKIYAKTNEEFDIRNNELSKLITIALDDNPKGIISKGKRKKYLHQVPEEVFDFIEKTTIDELLKLESSKALKQD